MAEKWLHSTTHNCALHISLRSRLFFSSFSLWYVALCISGFSGRLQHCLVVVFPVAYVFMNRKVYSRSFVPSFIFAYSMCALSLSLFLSPRSDCLPALDGLYGHVQRAHCNRIERPKSAQWDFWYDRYIFLFHLQKLCRWIILSMRCDVCLRNILYMCTHCTPGVCLNVCVRT